ncbi:Nuclear pore complex protein Nup85 [Apostasia shenzhenica]|uniref:Nuclear pore complex protein Nup85 n=1 Tax=Apostasia shenzhenica TaxID=1088818 RepID=A0A2I0ANV7_9ASPA|nr:Nuclear pore complex protein Nup85 [Apostasia shenzhenica]
MPGRPSDTKDALVPFPPEAETVPLYPVQHGVKPPIFRVFVSWSRGNVLQVACIRPIEDESVREERNGAGEGGDIGGKVMEVKLGASDGNVEEAERRRIAYGSVAPFALLQSRRNSLATIYRVSSSSSVTEWWQHVLEYSKSISELLGNTALPSSSVIEDPKMVFQATARPTPLKAAWQLMEIFYVDRHSFPWILECLVDWLGEYDGLLSDTEVIVHRKLVKLQEKLVNVQVIEDDSEYWEGISSALSIGWLEVVVKLLRLHGSYQLDQLDSRETENGLVEAVAVLVSTMPRMRLDLPMGKLGQCYRTKPDFVKGLEEMEGLAQKCMQLKQCPTSSGLVGLLIGILGESTEVVMAECLKSFGPWMVTHSLELLTTDSDQTEILLHEERYSLGGISIMELHRLIYAQVLSSHPLTWQIAPTYLVSCPKQGLGLLEILLYKQPLQNHVMILKNLEICRLYELERISSCVKEIAGIYHWKHGRKGCGIYWFQQAHDEARLNHIAQKLFECVGIADETSKRWEGLIELLGPEVESAGGLGFLHKYQNFKKSLQKVKDASSTDAAQQTVELLIQVKLLNWRDRPLLNVTETNLLLSKLQELSTAKLRPEFYQSDLPPRALSSVRLALATNLSRTFLEG